MAGIGARLVRRVHLSRLLARPGRHARAPTDSTGAGRPNTGERERTTRKDDGRVVMVVATAFSSDATPGKMGYIFLSFGSTSCRSAGIPSARAVRPVRDTMGWLTRFLAGKMEDPAKRQADFEAHMVETTAKCEEVCVRRNL